MQQVWQEQFKIKFYEVDYNGRLKLSCLFDYMQEMAGNHANDLGVGYEALRQYRLVWILSRVKVKMYKYPAWGDTISIETWPKGINRLFALRDFTLRDSAGQVIGGATTAWLLLDLRTMRPQRVQALPVELPAFTEKHGLEEVLEKLDYTGEMDKVREKTVTYSEIDMNHHVNNAKYVDWIMDCFSSEYYDQRQVTELQVNYISEAHMEDIVEMKRSGSPEIGSSCHLEGSNHNTGATVFQASVSWG